MKDIHESTRLADENGEAETSRPAGGNGDAKTAGTRNETPRLADGNGNGLDPGSGGAGGRDYHRSPLVERFESELAALRRDAKAAGAGRVTKDDLTVMSDQRDCYRIGTPAKFRDAEWAAEMWHRYVKTPRLHPRGFHYALVRAALGSVLMPNGEPFENDEKCYTFATEIALPLARWHGLIDPRKVSDNKHAAMRVTPPPRMPEVSLRTALDVYIPDADDLQPEVVVENPALPQAFTFILAAEKSSAGEVLIPLGETYGAGVCTPSGNMSHSMALDVATMIEAHGIATMVEAQGRPGVVLYVSDYDWKGYTMAAELGRYLQAYRDTGFLTHDVILHPVAVNRDTITEFNLPQNPVPEDKNGAEARRWRELGLPQVELDALLVEPNDLRKILKRSIAPYYDTTLGQRGREAAAEYEAEQNARLADLIDSTEMDAIRADLGERLEAFRDEIEALSARMTVSAERLDLPSYAAPGPNLPDLDTAPEPLLDTRWTWREQTMRLAARKRLEGLS